MSVPKRERMEYDEAAGLFRLFLEWILMSEKPMLVEFGHKFLG